MSKVMKLLFIIFMQLLLCKPTLAQYPRVKVAKDSINFVNHENILSVLDEYAHCLIKRHVDPFKCVRKSDFLTRIQQLKDSSALMDIDELLVGWLNINSLVCDEHTNIVYISRDIFPLQCYWFNEGVFITNADFDNQDYLYHQIIAVNDIPISRVVDQIINIIPNKNLPQTKKDISKYLFDPFVIHGLKMSSNRKDITYTLVSPDNDTVKITPVVKDKRTIHFLANSDFRRLLRYSRPGLFWYRYFEEGNYIYFKYASCFDDKKNPFKKIRESLLEDIESKKPQKIIIDMRDNGGGRPILLQPFIKSLARTDLNKKGKIFVLIGRKTFSSAIMNSASLRETTYATLVGEETRGNVFFYAGTKYYTLPATKLKLQYSTNFWSTHERYSGPLKPDVVIPETFADHLRGVDSALNYAIMK